MKKIQQFIGVAMLSLIALSASAGTPETNGDGKVIMMVTIEVLDYAKWRTEFDAGSAIREANGIKVLSVCRSLENEKQIIVIEEVESAQKANEFITLLKSKQKEGQLSKLDYILYDLPE